MSSEKKLRLITYLSPGIPIELYQVYQHYLEETLGCESYLIVESRWSGPPDDRVDPLTADEADIAFLCSTCYLHQTDVVKNKYIELLPVAPIHIHPSSELRPVCFSDIVIRKEKAANYKTFYDLKGHRWAYNGEDSLSGNLSVLAELKKMGFNASFFGHLIRSGSHHKSIRLVKDGIVDGAAIDSSVLPYWFKDHPEDTDKLHVLCSLGPLPIQPVVVNSRLPGDLKKRIADALLAMNKSPKWNELLAQLNVWGFKETDRSLYDKEKEIKDIVKDQSIHTAYY